MAERVQEVYNQLQDLVDEGDLVTWIEKRDGKAFVAWRINLDRYPNESYPVLPCGHQGLLTDNFCGYCARPVSELIDGSDDA